MSIARLHLLLCYIPGAVTQQLRSLFLVDRQSTRSSMVILTKMLAFEVVIVPFLMLFRKLGFTHRKVVDPKQIKRALLYYSGRNAISDECER